MDIYSKYGAVRVIHGTGTSTRLSGTILRPDARRAMENASRTLVAIEDLQAGASRVISRVTGAEAGLVTSGASAGLALAAAACIARLDIAKMERLPDTTGMKNELVIPRHHRSGYDHMLRAAGARLVEAGLNEVGLGVGVRPVEAWEIEASISERTAGIAYVARVGTPPLGEVAQVASRRGIPLIVDAAAELPPVSNLKRYIDEGADAVVFSGGKAIRGPQASGLLCGRRELVMSAALQMLDMDCRFDTWTPDPRFIDKSKLNGLPRHGIGRGFKVGKEEIVGFLTALELYAQEDESAHQAGLERMARSLARSLRNEKLIQVTYLSPTKKRWMPLVEVKFLGAGETSDMVDVVKTLRSGEPPVYLDESRLEEMILTVNPFSLQAGDLRIIAERLRQASGALEKGRRTRRPASPRPRSSSTKLAG